MTDENIEKALEIHYRRGGLPNCETCPYYNEFRHGDCLRVFGKDMQDYITRLKANNAILKKNAAEAFQQGLNEKRGLIEPEIRQETAKEVLQELKFLYKERAREYTNWDTNKVQAVTFDWLNEDLNGIAEEYGVEVEE